MGRRLSEESEVLNSIEGLILQEYSIRTDPFILKISAHSFRLGEGLVASLPSGDHTDNVRVGFEVFRRGIQAVFQHKAWTALADLCAENDEVGRRGTAVFGNSVNPVIAGKGLVEKIGGVGDVMELFVKLQNMSPVVLIIAAYAVCLIALSISMVSTIRIMQNKEF